MSTSIPKNIQELLDRIESNQKHIDDLQKMLESECKANNENDILIQQLELTIESIKSKVETLSNNSKVHNQQIKFIKSQQNKTTSTSSSSFITSSTIPRPVRVPPLSESISFLPPYTPPQPES